MLNARPQLCGRAPLLCKKNAFHAQKSRNAAIVYSFVLSLNHYVADSKGIISARVKVFADTPDGKFNFDTQIIFHFYIKVN